MISQETVERTNSLGAHKLEFQTHTINLPQNVTPINIRFDIEEPDTNAFSDKNFVLRPLDDGNIELLFLNPEDFENVTLDTQVQVSEFQHIPANVSKEKESINLDFSDKSKWIGFGEKSVEVPVIRNSQQESVIQHVSISSKSPNSPSSSNFNKNQQPIEPRPENSVLNYTCYSCIKCKEEFRSIVAFREHLLVHKAEKQFACTKCSAGFNVENNLKIHMVTFHPTITDMCPICNLRFQRKASLKSHIMMHQVEEIFTCDECRTEFHNDDDLMKHMEVHAVTNAKRIEAQSLICPYCKMDFPLSEYKQHVAKHLEYKKTVLKGKKTRKRKIGEKSFGHKCKYCDKTFLKGCLLVRHERIHTGEKPFKCSECSSAFAQKGTLHIHMARHFGIKSHLCLLCPAKFIQKGNLRAHIEKTHTAPKDDQKVFKCTHCSCIFTKIATLNGHMTKVHENQVTEKDFQGDIFDDVMKSLRQLGSGLAKSALKKDEPKQINNPPSESNSNQVDGTSLVKLSETQPNGTLRRYLVKQKKIGDIRWYFCNHCTSRFKKPSDLMRHFRTHTQEKPYECDICAQCFSLKSTLVNHYKVHNKTLCECESCDISFTTSRSYNAHMRRHEKKKAPVYACNLCDQMFTSLEHSNAHRATHEGEVSNTQNIIEPVLKQPLYHTAYGALTVKPPKPKIPNTGAESPLERPHQCKICNARFPRLMSLRRHMLCHSGDKRCSCNICPKTFITKDRLVQHMNYHKNIRNYECQICSKKFITASLLKRHTIIHNNFKPYSCPYCDMNFKTLLLSRTHIRNVHSLDVHVDIKPKKATENQSVETETQLDKDRQQNSPLIEEQQSSELLKDKSTALEKDLSRTATPPTIQAIQETTQQKPELLSVSSQENQQDLNPECQMVYLNLGDIRVFGTDSALNTNNDFSSLKLQNDALLFNSLNDLQDSPVLFSIDNTKPDMVDPNEVIKSATNSNYTTTTSVISKAPETRVSPNLRKSNNLATQQSGSVTQKSNGSSPPIRQGESVLRKNVKRDNAVKSEKIEVTTTGERRGVGDAAETEMNELGVSIAAVSTVDLSELPIDIINSEDASMLTENLISTEINLNPNDILYNAQVFCINCHKMFSDMGVFQKHVCSKSPDADSNIQLVISQDSSGSTMKSEFGEEQQSEDQIYEDSGKMQTSPTKILKDIKQDTNQIDTEEMTVTYEKFVPRFEEPILKEPAKPPPAAAPPRSPPKKVTPQRTSAVGDVRKLYYPLKCKFCPYISLSEEKQIRHMKYIHSSLIEKICQYCFKDFKKQSDLARHLRTHTGERPFLCDICLKSFSLKSTLESHKKTHQEHSTKVTCGVCNGSFSSKSSLKVHMLLHTGERPHPCSFCDQTFRTSNTRIAHEKSRHLKKSRDSPAIKTIRTLKPKQGPKIVKSVAEEVAEIVNREKENSKVDIASKKMQILNDDMLTTPVVIEPHLNPEQFDAPDIIDPTMIHQLRNTVLLEPLRNNDIILTTDTGTPLPLNLNDFNLLDYTSLEENDISATVNDLNVKMTLTGGSEVPVITVNESSMASHHPVLNVSDVNMGQTETESFGLYGINRVMKPTSGDFIKEDQRVSSSSAPIAKVNEEVRTTTQKVNQKVQCDICNKMYSSKDCLRKHKKNVHGQNKKFPCIKCDKGYDTSDELNKHIVKSHTGLRPYNCQYCNNSFGEESSLKTHIKRIHQNTKETDNALLGLQLDLAGGSLEHAFFNN